MGVVRGMRRHLQSYRMRAFLVILLLVMVTLAAISAAFYQSNRSFLESYIREVNSRSIRSIARLLDSIFYRASYASAGIAERGTIRTYVTRGQPPDVGVTDLELAVQDLVSLFAVANSEISSIYVYSKARNRVVTNRLSARVEQFHDRGWLDWIGALEATRPQLLFRREPVFDTPIISILRRIDEGDIFAGGIVVNIDLGKLRGLLSRDDTTPGEGLFVVQEQKQVIFSTDDGALGTEWTSWSEQVSAIDSVFSAAAQGELFNLDYYSVSGRALYEEKTRQLGRFLTFLLLAVVIVGGVVSVVLAGFAYRPIREIMDTLEHPDDYSTKGQSDDEIQYIENSVIRLMASNARLERRLAERFQSLRKAHYAALQLQINRHFLYNTLESIYWNSVEVFDPQDTVPQSVYSLSRFLRMILATDTMAITLAEEIEITRQYTNLLRLRFDELVTFTFAIPSELERVSVAKLILQPLIENAFYHGIKPTRRRGAINITGRQVAGRTEITVSDNGRGIPIEALEEIRTRLRSEIDLQADQIGLLNVAQRLHILFGNRASIDLESAEGHGTMVTIALEDALPQSELVQITTQMCE